MSQEPEQIGELIYQPNPNYPYQLPTDTPPHFWMTEQTGKLAAAMDDYFAGEALSPEALALIKQYLRQYIERVVMAEASERPKLLTRLDKLRSTRDIESFADELAEYGVEPF
jgi:hypothetical protein